MKKRITITESEIPDESVDCVFIDEDHSFDAVRKDLHFWWKKIKKGGMLLGDDYWMADVERAVKEFASYMSLELCFADNKINPAYKIYCFKKT